MISISISAIVYFLIAIYVLIITYKFKLGFYPIFLQLFFIFFWTWYLSFLCEKGRVVLSWFLISVPFLITMLFLIFISKNLKVVT